MYAKYLSIQHMDDVFNEVENPIFLNDLNIHTKEDRRNLKELMITTYNDTDVMSTIPSCLCGQTREGYNLGEIAPCCGTEVSTVTTRKMQPDIWIRKPSNCAKFMTPIAWGMLLKYGHTAKFNAIEWFANPNKAKPPADHPLSVSLMNRLLALNIPRGYNSLVENLDLIIDALESNIPTTQKRADLRFFFQYNRNNIFTDNIPIPSRIAFIVEKTSVGNYYDEIMNACLEAAMLAVDIENVRDVQRIEGYVTTILTALHKYYVDVVNNFLSKKPGWFRQLHYGGRMDYTFRNVITCQFEPHNYSDIQIPYDLAVTVLMPQLMNKLVHIRHMSLRQAYDYIELHTKKRDPLLLELLHELINDCPDNARQLALTRYPSLARTSTQSFRITDFTDEVTRLSALATRGPNADYDGDILTAIMMNDLETAEGIMKLDGIYDIHSVTRPGTIKNNIALPDTIIPQLFNYIDDEEWAI